jgi:hypothetical protein
MMTPEKATMADISGGKRDRGSDNTDKPVTTPNTRDSKLSCWDAEGLKESKNAEELIENGIITGEKTQVNDEYLDAPDVIDVDELIASGGRDDGVLEDIENDHTPKKLFMTFSDSDEDEDNNEKTKHNTKSTDDDDEEPTIDHFHTDSEDDEQTKDNQENNNNDQHSIQEKYNNNNNNNNKNKNNQNNKNNKNIDTNNSDNNNQNKATTDEKFALILTEPKALTSKWKTLDAASKKLMPFITGDRSQIEKSIQQTLKHLEKSEAKTDRDAWAKIFAVTYSAKGRNKSKFIKHLGVKLAGSDPNEIFFPHEFNGEKLIKGAIAHAWAGAYTFYGPGWIPEIKVSLDTSAGIDAPTEWWKSLSFKEVNDIQPFQRDDIFADTKYSMHDCERRLRIELGIDNSEKHIDPKKWLAAFANIQDTEGDARDTLLKLAMTPISIFGPEWFGNQERTKMISSSVTNFWIGAYRLAGGPWMAHAKAPIIDAPAKAHDQMEESPKKPAPNPSSYKKALTSNLKQQRAPASLEKVSFGAGVKSRSLFLARGPRLAAPVKLKAKADKRKHEDVYYSVECPPIDSDWKEAGAEITAHFVAMVEHIVSKDKKAIIHPWDSSGSDLSKKSDKVKSKQQARRYVNNSMFVRQGFETKFRIRVSHDVLPSLMELNSNEGLIIEHDHIQEKERTCIGFLVGANPDAANLEDMRASHENHSVLFGLKVLCEDRTINLSSADQKIPFKLRTQAIHIIVGAKQAVDARDRYNRVFGSRKEGGYPQGMKLRFVPDVADARFPVTPNTRMKAVKMMSKQKAFMANTKVVHTDTIAGLHTVLEKVGSYSLCQILMAIRSRDDAAMGLFIAIDEQHADGAYTTAFTVHNDRYEEAIGLIPLFCIIYEAKFGIAARQWFTEESKVVDLKYKWDAVEGQVVPLVPEDDDVGFDLDSDDEYCTAMADLLNIDTSGDAKKGFDFNIDYLIEEVSPSKNQYGDSGSVKTFRDECIELPTTDMDEEDDESISGTLEKPTPRSSSPDSITIQADNATQATSTLTEDTTAVDIATSLEQMMMKHPELAQSLWAKNSAFLSRAPQLNDNSKSAAVSPNEGVDGSSK